MHSSSPSRWVWPAADPHRGGIPGPRAQGLPPRSTIRGAGSNGQPVETHSYTVAVESPTGRYEEAGRPRAEAEKFWAPLRSRNGGPRWPPSRRPTLTRCRPIPRRAQRFWIGEHRAELARLKRGDFKQALP